VEVHITVVESVASERTPQRWRRSEGHIITLLDSGSLGCDDVDQNHDFWITAGAICGTGPVARAEKP
jgi:hypothetical protein